jgi:hypothetical protein
MPAAAAVRVVMFMKLVESYQQELLQSQSALAV